MELSFRVHNQVYMYIWLDYMFTYRYTCIYNYIACIVYMINMCVCLFGYAWTYNHLACIQNYVYMYTYYLVSYIWPGTHRKHKFAFKYCRWFCSRFIIWSLCYLTTFQHNSSSRWFTDSDLQNVYQMTAISSLAFSKVWDEITYLFQTSTTPPSEFGNGYVISSHTS